LDEGLLLLEIDEVLRLSQSQPSAGKFALTSNGTEPVKLTQCLVEFDQNPAKFLEFPDQGWRQWEWADGLTPVLVRK
jgi:hypothetical protein